MQTLTERSQKALSHAKEAKEKLEYQIKLRNQEREAKRKQLARKMDDPTPCKPWQKPSQEVADRMNEYQFKQEVDKINKSFEL